MSDPQRPHGLQPTRLLCPWVMVDNAHTGGVEVVSREVIAAPEATDHCAVVVKARLKE